MRRAFSFGGLRRVGLDRIELNRRDDEMMAVEGIDMAAASVGVLRKRVVILGRDLAGFMLRRG
jgi:hypothetical protein